MKRTPNLTWGVLAVAGALLLPIALREPASAQPKAEVAKWEYRVLDFKEDPGEAEKNLNRLGEEGWELTWAVQKVAGQTFPESPRAGRNDPGRVDTANYLILRRAKR